jgi:hypothetical protein
VSYASVVVFQINVGCTMYDWKIDRLNDDDKFMKRSKYNQTVKYNMVGWLAGLVCT